jgi:mannose-6-phosphate isomerase-like protein (cupin superfamily)
MTIHTDIAAPAAQAVHWLGTDYQIAVRAGSLGGFFAHVPAGEGPPLHIHHGEDEAIHVLDGAADFWLEGRVMRLVAGQGVFLPRSVPHTFRVVPDGPARLLGVVTPGGMEGFFPAAAAAGAGPHDPAGLRELADRFRLAFLGPSPLRP